MYSMRIIDTGELLCKCILLQIVQLESGPRIVLQGLQGNSLTHQQLALVQHQVKQQLLKGGLFVFVRWC